MNNLLRRRIVEEGGMQRQVIGTLVGLLAATGVAMAAPSVLGPDEKTVERATVHADAGTYWVHDGASLPVQLTPDADDQLHLPRLATAQLLVLDASTGRPVTAGRLRWQGLPDAVSEIDWSARGGRLDLGCRGGEGVELVVEGYRSASVMLRTDGRRHTVLIEPRGDLEIRLQPPAAAQLWLAARDDLSAVSPFHATAQQHEVDENGRVVVTDLDGASEYEGVVVAPGMAPVVGRIQGLPKRLDLRLDPGLAINGRVLDANDRPLIDARVRVGGRLETLGGFRYRQESTTDPEGRFNVRGLLAGEVVVTACAAGHACANLTVELIPDEPQSPRVFRLAPGHDLRLVVRDEHGRAASGATVVDVAVFRRHETDDDGVLVFEGVEPGATLELEIFGAGLKPWRGTVDTSRSEVVLRIPRGGVLEWPILTQREIAASDVVASWLRLNARGREIDTGFAEWDAAYRLVRADGLEPGPHRLKVRLPGTATLWSEVVEMGAGDEIQLAAVVPDHGLAIAGRVLDGSTYRPVAGAEVSCEPGSPHQFRKPHELERLPTAVSDAEGVFFLEGLDPGSCRAVVRAPGYAGWRRDGVEPDEIGVDLGDIELDHGMTVVGRVLDRADRPLTGVAVEITEDAAYAYFAETTAHTDHDGWFRAEALPVGRWALTARHGGQTGRAVVEGRSDETVTAELRIGGVRLEGEVWIGDRPASGGSLVLTTGGARGDGIVVMVQSDADRRRFFGIEQAPVNIVVGPDGRFVASGVEPAAYTASYTPPGAGGAPVGRELVVPQVETHRCLIQYSDAGLEGRVIDGDGLPVAGAAVFVRKFDGQPVSSGFSDGDGRFAFVGLDAGTVFLGAVHGEFSDSELVEVELRSGDRAGPLTLELKPPDGADLVLTVRSAGGSLSGAPVFLVGMDTLTGFTDGQGLATFTGVDPGRYRACAAAYGGAVGCGAEVALDRGDHRDQVLDLGRGGMIDVLLGPVERLPSLRVLTADGIDLTSMLMMVNPPQTGPEGISLGPLRADDYRIVVSTASGPRQGTIGTSEGETVELDLR
jgi:protocatechuate 3,4-dioxygenase beta subunit